MKRKNAEIHQQITDFSLRDGLTQLLNRRAVRQVLLRQESLPAKDIPDYAVIMLDIDKFKVINDQYGHNSGDSLLQSTAVSIQNSIRTGDYAFRYGGDEFLILLPHVNHAIAEQICSRIEKSIGMLHGYAFTLTISTGCAFRLECTKTSARKTRVGPRTQQKTPWIRSGKSHTSCHRHTASSHRCGILYVI